MWADTLRVAVIQTTVDQGVAWSEKLNQINMASIEEARAIKEIRLHMSALLHDEYIRPHIVLLPEVSVPLGFLPSLRRLAIELNAVVIAGMDFEIAPPKRLKEVMNRAAVIIPNAWGRSRKSTHAAIRYVGKTYPAKKEEEFLTGLKPPAKFKRIPEVWVFDAASYGRFAVAICYDFLDLERVSMYRQKIQHLFVLSYNRDISSFDHAAEALSRMIFCNVVVCNSGHFGGSAALTPYYEPAKRLIYRHYGNRLSTSQVVSLPVKELVSAQQGKLKAKIFKGLPPGAVAAEELKMFSSSI